MLESLFKKVADLRCFPVNIKKFLWTTFLIEHLRLLLLCCAFCAVTALLSTQRCICDPVAGAFLRK